jgi:hypothetical protein
MPSILNLYLDDSGTRHPDHAPGNLPAHGRDWFGLGGIMVTDEDEPTARQHHRDFCRRWGIDYPLHSHEIRGQAKKFAWLRKLEAAERDRFLNDLEAMLTSLPVLGIACVIDRPGYRHRYDEKYGRQHWSLCKSAFSIVVERAAKHALSRRRKLRVWFERADKTTDKWMQGYFQSLRKEGQPFDKANMAKYDPLSDDDLRAALYDCKPKNKSSPMAQIADMYLWPLCIGGYDRDNRAYAALMNSGHVIDRHVSDDDLPSLGVKYYCWDLVDAQKSKSPAQ